MNDPNQKIDILTQEELARILKDYNRANAIIERTKAKTDVESLWLEGSVPAFIKQQKRVEDMLLNNYGSRLFAYEMGLDQFNRRMAETFFGRHFPSRFGEFKPHNVSDAILTRTKQGLTVGLQSELSPKQDPVEATAEYLKLGVVGIINATEIESNHPNYVAYKGTPIKR